MDSEQSASSGGYFRGLFSERRCAFSISRFPTAAQPVDAHALFPFALGRDWPAAQFVERRSSPFPNRLNRVSALQGRFPIRRPAWLISPCVSPVRGSCQHDFRETLLRSLLAQFPLS